MEKGVTGEKMVFLIVAVCLGIFVLWFLFSRLFPSLMQQVLMMFGLVKPTNIELAILCSYHRCTDGCMSMRVQEISWKDGDQTVTCQSFCEDLPPDAYELELCTCKGSPNSAKDHCYGGCENIGKECDSSNDCAPKLTTSLYVCGSKYPVTITLKENEKIDKSHLTLGSAKAPDVKCMLPSNAGQMDAWDVAKIILTPALAAVSSLTLDENWLVIDASLIKSYGDKEDCAAGTITFSHDSFKTLMVGPDKSAQEGQKVNITTSMNAVVSSKFISTYVYPE